MFWWYFQIALGVNIDPVSAKHQNGELGITLGNDVIGSVGQISICDQHPLLFAVEVLENNIHTSENEEC
jgi:hypothetical protein